MQLLAASGVSSSHTVVHVVVAVCLQAGNEAAGVAAGFHLGPSFHYVVLRKLSLIHLVLLETPMPVGLIPVVTPESWTGHLT